MSTSDNSNAGDPGFDGPSTFEEFDLLPEVAGSLRKMGFEEPTPVQSAIYEDAMKGLDLIVMAQTGTGKTAAFGIPMAQTLDKDAGVQALVLTPTRELALQVSREVDRIGKGRGIRTAAVYGGASFTKQVEEVGGGAQIVVGTPGRVLDHMRRGTIPFKGLGRLVLDEADEMLSMGFEKELSEIMGGLPKERQTLLFSATIPDDIQRLAGRYMGEAKTISVSGDAIGAKEISHFVYLVSGTERLKDLVRLMETEEPESAIVFCNTKDETQSVARYLKDNGYNAEWINSDLSQSERERVMTATRKGKVRFMVATDVAARGIDISHLSHVINYSFPESLEIYVHRTGRTGRQGRHGAALSLITPQDIGNLYFLRLMYKIFPVERTLPGEEDQAKKLELERLKALRDEFEGGVSGAFIALARRVVQDANGENLLGWLLEKHFAEGLEGREAPEPIPPEPEPEPQRTEETAAEGVEAKPQPEPEPEPEPQRTEETAAEEVEAKPQPEPEPRKSTPPKKRTSRAPRGRSSKMPPPDEDAVEIYVDAGRKDGLRISSLMKDIVELTGLARAAVGRVRMLTRSTFVAVPREHYDAVFEALGKLEVDGRRVKVEPAEES